MRKIKNVDLSKKTTFHIGGLAENFYIPETEDELIELINTIGQEKYYIISGGSNLLINDKAIYKHVISMEEIDTTIEKFDQNKFYVGCSNRIQKVINFINEKGYGGFEELYCLPALFGGIIYMNAGIGTENNCLFTISDFVVRVKAYSKQEKKIVWINKEKCQFLHRKSIFHNNLYIILGAEIQPLKQEPKISKERINKRITICKEKQEWGKGCFGTCFSISNRKILKLMSIFNRPGKSVYQSKKNCNWLVNNGNGKYDDAIKIINQAKKIHKLLHCNIECEVIIWE